MRPIYRKYKINAPLYFVANAVPNWEETRYEDLRAKNVYVCSGLKDKNDNWIYEGDILKINWTEEADITKKVIFKEGMFAIVNSDILRSLRPLAFFRSEAVEIIGNEVENPELDSFNEANEEENKNE